ncbi:MAG TPA: hypothetical protein VFM25_03895 [Verrucomicrobiae bacterium]|nr:hypothetical protein [Verrucomicrobiae bacterium]
MSNQKTNTLNPVLKPIEQQIAMAKRVDEIASGAMELFKVSGSFESELGVAQAISDLRATLTPELMQPIMALMNTDLGFRTDRDSKLAPRDKDGNPMQPYSVDIVRECFIESKLRGFHSVGNEWNIIAGRFYACRNGLKRKCEQWPGVTDLKTNWGLPRSAGEKGAIVPVKATWRKDGVADSIETEIPVRVNFGMGADAILGKAERKIYKRIHDRLSGISTPEGEAGEDIELQPGKASPRFAEAKMETVSESQPEPPQQTAQQELAAIVMSAGYAFEDFIAWGRDTGHLTPVQVKAITSFESVPENIARRFIGAKAGLIRGLKANTPQTVQE